MSTQQKQKTLQDKTLKPEQLRLVCDPGTFDFESTEELDLLEETIGQERAVRSVAFGIEIESPGYHMYALGPVGTGKTTTIQKFLDHKVSEQPVPDDWCYVNNFDEPDKPRALCFPAGTGRAFREDMDQLAEELKAEVPKIFEGEEYEKQQEQLQQEFQERQQEEFEKLRNEAEEEDFKLIQTPQGIILAPVIDGEVLSSDEFNQLDEETHAAIAEKRQRLQEQMREMRREMRQFQKDAKEREQEIDQQMIDFSVGPLIEELQEKYADHGAAVDFLEKVREDILAHSQDYKKAEQAEQMQQQLPFLAGQRSQEMTFDHYRANLIVDNGETEGAPVILERNPNYYNLLGRVEHQAQFGALVTDFRMIKAGALHRANGGYLMIHAVDVLTKPFAWEALKRTLQNKEIRIEPMGQEYRAVMTQTLAPEPIPLDVKVVVIGDPFVYYLLYNLDEDFQELFKVKADFAVQMDRTDETVTKYAQFIASICHEENLRHFTPSGVAKVVEQSGRLVADQSKLSTKFGDIVDLLREASYWASQNGNQLVTAEDVTQAIEEHIYRSNKIEERLREMIEDGTILIDTDGEAVGQVNGLSVMSLGDYSFGRPSRITARTYVGQAGVINIDRETELGGPIHNKGMMIIIGFLGGKYARQTPLALSASLTFEQTYSGIEGDSASSAELYALLSSLSDLPLRQNFAVTGSVNQHGQIQAIGGVNEKIEGFFDVCKINGLSGDQGVLIPESNVRHLMLREDVIQAVRDGKFHIYPVATLDEGITILTGVEAGERQNDGTYPEGTVNHAVQMRLLDLVENVKAFAHYRDGNGRAAN